MNFLSYFSDAFGILLHFLNQQDFFSFLNHTFCSMTLKSCFQRVTKSYNLYDFPLMYSLDIWTYMLTSQIFKIINSFMFIPSNSRMFSHFVSSCLLQLDNAIAVQAAVTKCHMLSSLSKRHLFLIVLEAKSPRSSASRSGAWRAPSSWFADVCLLTLSHMDGREGSGLFLYFQGINSIPGLYLHDLI